MVTPPSVKRRRYGASPYALGYSPRIDDPFRRTAAQRNRDYPPLGSDEDDAIDPSLSAELPTSYPAYNDSFDSIDDSLVPLTAHTITHHEPTPLDVEDSVILRDVVQYDAGDEAEATLVENGSDQDSATLMGAIKSSPKDGREPTAASKLSRKRKQKLTLERIIDFNTNDDDDGEPFPDFRPVDNPQVKKSKQSANSPKKKRKSEADAKSSKKSKSKRKEKKSKHDAYSSSDDDAMNLEDLKRKTAPIPQGYHPMFATYGYGVNPHDPRVQQIFWPPIMQHSTEPGATHPASMPPGTKTHPSANGIPSHMAPHMPHMFDTQYMNAAMQMTQFGGGAAPWMMHPGLFPGAYPLAPQQPYQISPVSKVETSETSAPSFSSTSTASHMNRSASLTSQLRRRTDEDGAAIRRTVKRGTLFSRRKPKRGSSKLKTVLSEQSDVPVETPDERDDDTEVDLGPFRPATGANTTERESTAPSPEPPVAADAAADTGNDSERPDGMENLLNPTAKRKRGRPMGSKTKKRKDEAEKLKAMQERDAAEIEARQKEILQAIDAVPRELMFDDSDDSDVDGNAQQPQETDATDAEQWPKTASGEVLPAFLENNDEVDELERAFNMHKNRLYGVRLGQTMGESESSASGDNRVFRESEETEVHCKENLPLPRHVIENQKQCQNSDAIKTDQPKRPAPALHPYLTAFDLSDDESPALLSRLRRGAVLPEPTSPMQEDNQIPDVPIKTPKSSPMDMLSQQSLPSTFPDSMDEPLTQTQQSTQEQHCDSAVVQTELNPVEPLVSVEKCSSPSPWNDESTKRSIQEVSNAPDDDSPLFVAQDGEDRQGDSETVLGPEQATPAARNGPKFGKKEQTTPTQSSSPKSDQPSHTKTLRPIKATASTPAVRRPLPSSPLKLKRTTPLQSSPLANPPLNYHSLPLVDPETPTEIPLTFYEITDTASPGPETELVVREAPRSPGNTDLTASDIRHPNLGTSPATQPRVSPDLSSEPKTLTPSQPKIPKRKSMLVEPPRRHSLLSLYDDVKKEAKAASARNALSGTPSSSSRRRRESRDQRLSRPAKAGNSRHLEKAHKAQSTATFSTKLSSKRKSMPAQLQICGSEGYSCGNDFCFSCL